MSNPKIVDAIRNVLSGHSKSARDTLIDQFHPDIVFEFPESLPYGGTFKGVDGYKQFWDLVFVHWNSFDYDLHEIIDTGDRIIVPVVAHGESKTGRSMWNEHLFFFKVEGGKIVYGRIYADSAKGRDAISPWRTFADVKQ
ncbi:nuclear transport factor 2 family protein [Paraburkholderia sp. C35]|uniref:nuclear transport factor 2 family protein n=1 Tax=Paraburkholderia sp. C35 TaxID=2126993 RepID=UPI0013A5564C|nr:nuclear transport factor 2 family protein [Paraburkholderia sp. C35]